MLHQKENEETVSHVVNKKGKMGEKAESGLEKHAAAG